MRLVSLKVLLSVFFIISGCATVIGTETEFSRWSGSDIYKGDGGLVEEHDGIEFWRAESPEKEFSIVGMITQSKSSSIMRDAMFDSVNRGEIVSIVLSNGADGVIVVDSQKYISGYTTTIPQSMPHSATTRANMREDSAMLVFKYER